MAEDFEKIINPFEGMSMGQAVTKLKAEPELASDFDSYFGDGEEVSTLERARLHAVHSFYRNTSLGAAQLAVMSNLVVNPPEQKVAEQEPDAADAQRAAAARLARGATKKEFVERSQGDILKINQERYDSILTDLGQYEQMRPFENGLEFAAAAAGALAGGLPTPENLIGFGTPITGRMVLQQGLVPLIRMAEAGVQLGAVNLATDPLIQNLSIYSGVQKNYDWFQTALAFPMGAVTGGGLVGLGEVISKTSLRDGMRELAKTDPQMVSRDMKPFDRTDLTGAPTKELEQVEAPRNLELQNEHVQERLTEKLAEGETQARLPGALRDEPIPTPSARPPEVVKSLQTMTEELEKEFDVPIRQGRVKGQALGTFNTQTGVIHNREYPDFSVNAHEVGHALEKKLGSDMTALMNRNAAELDPLDYAYNPIIGGRTFEGYAEFIRLYMTNPAAAQRHAPVFISEFQNFLEAKSPQTLQKLINFQKAYKNYLDAAPEQIILAGMVNPDRTFGDKIMKTLDADGMPPTIGNVLRQSYNALINQNEDLYRVTREIGDEIKKAQGGKMVDLLPSEDPRIQFEMLAKSAQTAMNHVIKGVVPWGGTASEGPSLALALATASKRNTLTGKWDGEAMDNFSGYLIARASIHRWDQFNAGMLTREPVSFSQAYAQAVIDKFDKEFPQFRAASDMVHDYNRRYLQRAKDAGVNGLTDEAFLEITKNPFFVPLKRKVDDLKTGTGKPEAPGQAIKGFGGSMRDIINPIHAILEQNMAFERAIWHNRAVTSLVDFSKRAGTEGGKFVEPLPAHEIKAIDFDMKQAMVKAMVDRGHGRDAAKIISEDFLNMHFGGDAVTGTAFKSVTINGKKEPIVFYSRNGVLDAARFVTKEEGFGLYELFQTVPKPAADLSMELMSLVSHGLLTGVVTHPVYALRNLFRDQITAFAFVPGNIPIYSTARGVYHMASGNKFAHMYREFGGIDPSVQLRPLGTEVVNADIDAIAKQGFSVRKIFTLESLRSAITAAEMATRLGAVESFYKQKIKMGLSDYEASLSATREATDLLDFGRHGSHLEMVRAVTPFFNAWFQSLDKANRVMNVPLTRWVGEQAGIGKGQVFSSETEETQRALMAWMKLGISGFGLGAVWAAMFWEKDGYRDMGPGGKGANFVIPIGDKDVLLLPKPWELAMGFTAGEYMYAMLAQNDPRAAGHLKEAAWDSFKPPIPIWSNPMIKTTSEAMSNYNTFTGGPIVPERMARREKEYQFDANTGIVAKKLGKVFGWSPKKVDYVISGYLGYWGKDLTIMGRGNEDDDMTSNLIDHTLLRAGIKDPTMLSDARKKYWDHMGRTTGDYSQAVATYNDLVTKPNLGDAKEYFDKLPSSRKAWVILHSGGDETGRAAFNADDRRAHPLTRAGDAVGVLSKVYQDVMNNSLNVEGTNDQIKTTPDTRKKLIQTIGQMSLAEMTNGLILTHEPGYNGRQIFDPEVFMKEIRQLSPAVADEIESRYVTKKIYKVENIARVYDEIQTELLRSGTGADIRPLSNEVKFGGYQFQAERRKRPTQFRTTIPGKE